ncbi:unnamed protein product [Rhizophagus irregularis]|uniref:Serine-threonine/tyrosine-protein kinase catalytic domain-containing protein n=1 Tax=Rhizophagus irregularis TaxID=588596 RepID=A0A916EI77_9GLOM|nr:unnamed protein product [Rhizophagus irregularis]CAB5390488.1 unnamed protein product [Rhizophagus irregularis]
MKKCWDSDPSNRPTIAILENVISEWIRYVNDIDVVGGNYIFEVSDIDNQLKNDMLEFVKTNKTLEQEQANTSIIQSHPPAHYTSRNVTEEIEKSKDVSENFVQENSELLECVVKI